MKKKIIVTGGAGFIGSHLVDVMVGKGYDVHVIDDLSAGKKENVNKNSTLHVVDIRDKNEVEKIIKGSVYAFHLAALPRVQYSIEHPDITTEVNVNGTLNILMAAKKAKVKKLVFASSASVYGDQEKMPLTEDMIADPKSPYGLQKSVGEQLCKLWSDIYSQPTIILRYFNVYGQRQDPDGPYALVVGKFFKLLVDGKPLTITGDGEQTRDFTHIDDVVQANILAAESETVKSGEVINIGAGNNVSVNRLAELIGGPIKYVESRLEPKHCKADNTKAKKLLSWEPKISIEEGIKVIKSRL